MIATAQHLDTAAPHPGFQNGILGGLFRPAAPTPVLAQIGPLSVRLAGSPAEIEQAQRLRYQVFVEEGGARVSPAAHLARLETDPLDPWCDHLMVMDERAGLVGTTRLLPAARTHATGGFYSASEFDLAPLLARHPGLSFLEIGRSCIAASHRSRLCLDLLWRGIAARAMEEDADVLIGCASLPGTDPDRLAGPLALLHAHSQREAEWCVSARAGLGVSLNRGAAAPADLQQGLRDLPPLLRGYLRLGARVSQEAVVDHEFGTTDVLVMLPLAEVGLRYRARFVPQAA